MECCEGGGVIEIGDRRTSGTCSKTFPASWFENEGDAGQCCGTCGRAVRNHAASGNVVDDQGYEHVPECHQRLLRCVCTAGRPPYDEPALTAAGTEPTLEQHPLEHSYICTWDDNGVCDDWPHCEMINPEAIRCA